MSECLEMRHTFPSVVPAKAGTYSFGELVVLPQTDTGFPPRLAVR